MIERERFVEAQVCSIRFPVCFYTLELSGYGRYCDLSAEQISHLINSIRDRGLNILLVDDEASFRKAMRFNLMEMFGAKVTDVQSGLEAIELFKGGSSYDLIFVDIMMSPLGGLETLRALRSIHSECRVVMMSAYTSSPEWNIANDLGVDLVSKPIPEDDLIRILSK